MRILRPLFNFSIILLLISIVAVLWAKAFGEILPPGKWMAFSSQRNGGDWDIFVSDLQRGLTIALTYDDHSQVLVADLYPTWSPDGEYITFMSSRDTNYELYIMDADGSHPRNLSGDEGYDDGYGVWSPDGTQILFSSNRITGNSDIYLVQPDSGSLRQLTFNDSYDGFPSWSPDGTQFVYTSYREDNVELYRMDITGSEAHLTNLTAHLYDDFAPSWSPDGRFIAFFSNRDGQNEIYSMDADGSNQRRLTQHPADDTYPMWLPDNSGLLFTSNRAGDEEIFLQPMLDGLPAGELRNLTNNPANDRFAAMRP